MNEKTGAVFSIYIYLKTLSRDFFVILLMKANCLSINYIKYQGEWTGKVSDLFLELTKLAEETGINTKSRVFPSSSQVLSKKMKIVKPNLYSIGIGFDFKRRNYGSIVHIWTEDFFGENK